MSIDSLSSNSSSRGTHLQQIRQDLTALQSDLQSGNTAQAQSDFATLLNDAPRLKNALSAGTASTSNSSSAASSLSALSTALQSGDTSGATTALASLQQSLGSAHHHHHHHHHGGGGAKGSLSPNVQGDMQTLSTALQSGNLTSAQQALTQLEQDDPALAIGSDGAGGVTLGS